jgi:hypothetical protein
MVGGLASSELNNYENIKASFYCSLLHKLKVHLQNFLIVTNVRIINVGIVAENILNIQHRRAEPARLLGWLSRDS